MPHPFALDVVFVPAELEAQASAASHQASGRGLRQKVPASRPNVLDGSVAVVIDVLRASSTIVTLIDRGCASVGLAASTEAAREAGRAANGAALLCGEEEGMPPYGFDHGNSPSEFAGLDFTGKHVILSTTNGTGALRACRDAPAVLVGALLNANAVVREALELVKDLRGLVLVCAGRAGRFVLDDAVTAGYLCHVILNEARVRDVAVSQGNGAIAAYRLYHSYPSLLPALNESASGQALYPLRLERDISYCARPSISKRVPRLARQIPKDWAARQGLYLLD
ncbi:MAG: 2-phosphosulfolactate phosphatase [Chloroflexota bacterium]